MFRLRAVGAQGPPLNAESFDWRVAAQRQGVCYLRFLESTFVLRVLIRRGALALIRGSDVLRGFVCAKQTQLDGLSSALLRAPRFFAAIPAGFDVGGVDTHDLEQPQNGGETFASASLSRRSKKDPMRSANDAASQNASLRVSLSLSILLHRPDHSPCFLP